MREWYQRPTFVVFTSICTIVAVPLSIYLYLAAEKHRDLSYAIAPARTVVVDPEQASSLRLFVNSTPVTSAVSSLQLRIWNRGNDSIRPGNVLEPIRIVTEPRVRIFEARIVRPGRTVSGIRIDTSHISKGVVPISWAILEENDGATIQLIYSGRSDVSVDVMGVIEGQRQVSNRTDAEAFTWKRALLNVGAGVVVGILLNLVLEGVRRGVRRRRNMRHDAA